MPGTSDARVMAFNPHFSPCAPRIPAESREVSQGKCVEDSFSWKDRSAAAASTSRQGAAPTARWEGKEGSSAELGTCERLEELRGGACDEMMFYRDPSGLRSVDCTSSQAGALAIAVRKPRWDEADVGCGEDNL